MQLNTNVSSLTVMNWRSDLKFLHLSLWIPLARLSAILDSEFDINLTLLMNSILYVIALLFPFSFLIGTENVIYFFMFSPNHSNCSSNSPANSLIVKWYSWLEPLWNTIGISFCVLYLRFTDTMWGISIFSCVIAVITSFLMFFASSMVFPLSLSEKHVLFFTVDYFSVACSFR